jgi:site-specific recombinase XerD
MAAIDSDWLREYERKRAETAKPNTVWHTMKFMRKMMRMAYDQKLIKYYPFDDYKMPGYKKTDRLYLTLDEVDKLINLMGSVKLTDQENATLCYFLLECLIGIRHSDWGKHTIERIIDTDRIKLTAQKNKQPIYIAFDKSPRLKKVIEYIQENEITYNQPIQLANRHLKLIAQLAEIDKPLTTHVGRHTCATLLLEIGYSEEYISEMLGISKSIVATYAKITRRKLQAEYDKLGGL